MPLYLDIISRPDERAAAAAARLLIDEFSHVGKRISSDLSKSLSGAFAALDGSAARREFLLLEQAARRAADVQEEAARREVRALGQVEVAQRRLNEVTDKYGADSSRAAAANVALVDSHARAAKSQRDHAAATADAANAHTAFASAAAGSTAAVSRFHQAATIASAGLVGGFVAGAIGATKAAGDFQVQLVRLQTVGGELPGNLHAIHDGLMALASQTGWEPTQLATGMLKVEQAGYRGTTALTVFKAAAQAAAEEGIGLDEAANAVTTTLGDYHLGADEAANVTSKMVEAVRLSKTTFSEFTSALHNVEPTAAAVGDSLSDLLATLGMLTKSGMHADQASDNLNHALSSLGNIQPKQREMLAALGLDPRLIPQDLHTKGYIDTAQEIRGAVDSRLGPNGNVILDAFENNPASQALEHEEYSRLGPAEKDVADRIMSGQLSYKDFRKSRGGLGYTESKIVDQWAQTHENNQGFNRVLKSLNTDQLGVMQALQTAVGGQDNARTLLQVTDQNNSEALKHRQEIADAHADPNGDVMEYKRSQENFNAQWKDLKGAVDALKIEFGEDFLPSATKWVHALETGVHWMQQHRDLVKDLIEDVTILSGLFLGMKLSTGLVNTVKEFRKSFGLTKTAVDRTNVSLRDSAPAAQAGAAGINTAATEEQAAQRRVKAAVDQANQQLRAAGTAAQEGSAGVMEASAENTGAQQRLRTAAADANTQLRGAGAAAEAGAAGVVNAANTEVGAMGRVIGAANRAKGALAAVGGMALSMGGDALQGDTRNNTNPHKLGVIASDAGNMAMIGGAVGSVIPGVGTAIGAGVGALLGGGYALYDQYFSGHHDVAAPVNPTPDMGPVPAMPDTAAPTPDLTAPVPDTSAPETPDLPYAGGGGGGGGGKKAKDTDPLDEDLKRIERLQTEANEIQARIADDQKSNDPARQGEIPWLEKKLDEIKRELGRVGAKGDSGAGSGGSGSPFMPVKLDDNWLQGGLPGLARNAVGFLEDLVLGPLEVAAFGGVPGAGGKRGASGAAGPFGFGAPGAVPEIGGAAGTPGSPVPVFVTNWGGAGGPGAGMGGGPGGAPGRAAPSGAAGIGGGASAGAVPGTTPGVPGNSGAGTAAVGPGSATTVGPGSATTGDWGLPGGATDSEKWLLSHLAAAGFSAGEIRGILAMNRVESGGSDMGMLGLTQGQAPTRSDKLATFLNQWRHPQGSGYHGPPGKNGRPPGVDANGNVVDSDQFLDWLSGAVEGQAGLAHDWQGNAQPSDYRQRVRYQYNRIRPPVVPSAAPVGSHTAAPAPADSPVSAIGIFPPDLVAEGQRRGWIDANGNINKPGAGQLPLSLGSVHNPMSIAPSALPGANMPFPTVSPAPQYHAKGGPIGTDTVPAWLSPGEEVERVSAVQKYGQSFMDRLNAGQVDPAVRYFGVGGGVPAPQAPAPQAPPAPPPAPPKAPPPPKPPQKALKPGGPGKPPVGKPVVGSIHSGSPLTPGEPEGDQTHKGLETPASNEQWFGEGQPASKGIGFGGGLLGAAEGAASQAAGIAASMGTFGAGGGAASSAMQMLFQLANRTAAYGAQVAGIGVEGLLETFLPADSPLSNFSSTLPGKLLAGVAGVRPPAPDTAGKTRAPLTSHESRGTQGSRAAGGDGGQTFHIAGDLNVHPQNFGDMVKQVSDEASRSAYSSASSQYQFSRTP